MQEISPDEFNKQLEEGNITAIDVREPWEFEECNIGTLNISLYQLPYRIDDLANLKNKHIVVFCQTGKRGGQARKVLLQNNFTQVSNLAGGIESILPEEV